MQCVHGTIPGITRESHAGYLDRGGRLVCSVFMGPSWELPWVLGNPGILRQGRRLVCSVFMALSQELPWVLGNPKASVQCVHETILGITLGTWDTWTGG